jgi:uncharacterized protein YdbL (DUF1318 family)
MTTRRWWWGAAPLALLLGGCVAVTVNVNFPQEKIDSAASSIEDLVRSPAPPAAPATPVAPKRDGGVAVDVLSWLGPRHAEAQVPELRVQTPEIMAAIQSRRARYPQLAAAITRGCIGENNQGLVEPRPGPGCGPDAAALVAAENRDREFIYRTLMEQNKMPPTDLPRVRAAFAAANREKAPAGTWVQDAAGQWTRK